MSGNSVPPVSHPVFADRLEAQLAFLVEIDKLKTVLRQTPITDGSRRENSGEHSWHLAMFATVLAEYSSEPIDISKVVLMLLLHDLVEIDAGDTFIYADALTQAKQEVDEAIAADRIFGMLPEDQRAYLRGVWDEFESRASAESRFAKTIDRMQPLLLNRAAGGGSWALHGISVDKTRAMIAKYMDPECVLTEYSYAVADQAVIDGILLPAPALLAE